MKKKIITLLSFIILSFSMLTGCGSFIEDGSIEIAGINSQILDDGRTMVVITYTDEEVSPTIFYIPKGETGEDGEQGNGIKSITYATNDLYGTVDIVITFTDSSMEPVKLTLTNGVSIKSIEEVKDEDGNNIGFIIHYTDGTSSNQIDIPQGQQGTDGVGISYYRQITNDDGSSKIIFQFTDGRIFECTIPAPERGKDGRGIEAIIGTEDEEYYYVTFKYNDGSEDETLQFNKPSSPVEWDSGDGVPGNSFGEEGDFYFDTYGKAIYKKIDGVWVLIIDFESPCVVTFNLNAPDAYFPEGFGYSSTYVINSGHCFYSSNKQVPIPLRTGYIFKGWYTTENTPSVVHGAFTDLTTVKSNMTLYASWENI